MAETEEKIDQETETQSEQLDTENQSKIDVGIENLKVLENIEVKLTVEVGENISGTVFSFLTTLTKIGFALAAVLPYLVLELYWGFDISIGTSNTESSKMAIYYIYTFVPIISYSIASYLLFTHSLGREDHEKIKSELSNHAV